MKKYVWGLLFALCFAGCYMEDASEAFDESDVAGQELGQIDEWQEGDRDESSAAQSAASDVSPEGFCMFQCSNGPSPGETWYLTCSGTCSTNPANQEMLCNGERLRCSECTLTTCVY